MFWNVASAQEWDFTVHWSDGTAQLRTVGRTLVRISMAVTMS